MRGITHPFFLLIITLTFGFLSEAFAKSRLRIEHRGWQDLAPKRTLTVQFVSKERVKEFLQSWPSHEDHFFAHMQNVSLLYAYPHVDAEYMQEHVAAALDWTLVESITHFHTFTHSRLLRYTTPKGLEVFMQSIIVHLPSYFLSKPVVPTCVDRKFSLQYALYSGSVWVYQLLHLPLLSRYDFLIKIDTDIDVLKPMPDVGAIMQERGCKAMHSAFQSSTTCEDGSVPAMKSFLKSNKDVHAASFQYPWCSTGTRPPRIFHGNFVGFSTRMLQAPAVQRLSTFLYEEWADGYFPHRWGDQASYMLYTCMALDVPDIYAPNPEICDLSDLRHGKYFKHT